MPTLKVTVEGTSHELEIGSDAITLPDGYQLITDAQIGENYITKAAHDAKFGDFRKQMERKLEKAGEGRFTVEDFLQEDNQEQLQHLVDMGRERIAKLVGVEAKEVDLERIKAKLHDSFKKTELEPILEREAEKDKLIEKILEKGLKSEITSAMRAAGVEDGEAMETLLVDHYRGRVRYSPDHDSHFVLDKDRPDEFAVNTAVGDGQPPYLPVVEDLKAKRGQEAWQGIFSSKARSGVDIGEPGKKGGPGLPANVGKKSDLKTNAEKAAFITKHGFDAWNKLPA